MKTTLMIIIALLLIAVLTALAFYLDRTPAPIALPDLSNPQRIAAGQAVYQRSCAVCHGHNLEGQPNWTTRLPNGRLPAPPHDDSGHTWHHPNEMLFAITKHGLRPPYAPEGYASDMPAFAGTLTDSEIWDVLAFIQSRWSERIRARHADMQKSAGR